MKIIWLKKIIQVTDSIPWVCCASGNVFGKAWGYDDDNDGGVEIVGCLVFNDDNYDGDGECIIDDDFCNQKVYF